MPTAIVKISDEANTVINIIKAKHNLKDKSQTINRIIEEYGKALLEPHLKPAFKKQSFAKKYEIDF